MRKFELELFADYFQFYIQDDNPELGDLSDAWTDQTVANKLAIADGVIGIGTARNMDVPVELTIANTHPTINESDFDKFNYTTLKCSTGRLVIAGCTDYFPEALRIDVLPKTYKVIVGYKNLSEISADGLDGNDSYHIWLYDD